MLTAFAVFVAFASARNATKDINHFLLTPTHNSLYKWGLYKPHTIFSVKDRQATPTTFGIMWFPTGTRDLDADLVYYVSDLKDPRDSYSFDYHNGQNLSVQEVTDHTNNVRFTIKWAKTKTPKPGEQFWEAEVAGEQIDKNGKDIALSLIFFATTELPGSYFEIQDTSIHTEYVRKCHTRTSECADAENANYYRFGSKSGAGAVGDVLQIGLNAYDRDSLWEVKDFVSAYRANFSDFTDKDPEPEPFPTLLGTVRSKIF